MVAESGIRLDAYLRERGPVPCAKAARIAEEVLAQIGALAARGGGRALSGISPSRILVSPNGQVVLLGPVDELPAAVSAPEYAAPEEIRGAPCDGRTAIYSFGCALFEILTGRPPFAGEDSRAVLRAHLSVPPPDPRLLSPEIPPALSEVVRSFLAKDPSLRPSDTARATALIRSALGVPGAPPLPARVPPAGAPAGAPAGVQSAAVPGPDAKNGPSSGQNAAPPSRGASPRGNLAGSPGGAPSGLRPARPPTVHPKQPPFNSPPARGAVVIGGPRGSPPRKGGPPSRAGRGGRVVAVPRGADLPQVERARWFFVWCGLALGVLLSLILVTDWIMKVQTPPPPPPLLTNEEKEKIRSRRELFQRTLKDEERIASMEFERLNRRLSFPALMASVGELIDRFAHTPAARSMAEEITNLRGQIDDARRGGEEARESMPEEEASPVPDPPADPPASGGEPAAPRAGGVESDDLNQSSGGDDGKKDL